jgi:hypothetical protein
MVIMDTSLIGVALPEMQDDLGFSQEDLSWVSNATSSPWVVCCSGAVRRREQRSAWRR